MPDTIIIVGAFHEIIELAEECGCVISGLIDHPSTAALFGYPIICCDETAEKFIDTVAKSTLVLAPDSPIVRDNLHQHYSSLGLEFSSLISPGAKRSKSAELGEGVVMQWGTHASAGSKLGRFVKLNVGANVMHDSIVGEFTTIAPNAVILGRVCIGNHCYVGSNATILPGVKIGNHVIIGAGSVVTKDVPDGRIVKGNPARDGNLHAAHEKLEKNL